MAQIEIDFEVWKALTLKRETETTSMNDVLRELLKLPRPSEEPTPIPVPASGGCNFKGVELPNGTKFRANYKGQIHTGEISNGKWMDSDGNYHTSPSSAAHAITGSGINGWWFWACKRPSDTEWTPLGDIRNAYKKSLETA